MFIDLIVSFILFPDLCQNQLEQTDFLVLSPQEAQEVGVPQRNYTDLLDVKITAEKVIALDVASGEILYQRNAEQKSAMASITKLMTALVFLDHNPGWQNEFYTIAEDRRNGGIIHLNTEEVLSTENLFKTAIIASDNDAAAALARSTGLSEAGFIKAMNDKAKELGLDNTVFADPTGLSSQNISTAKDIAKLLNYALNEDMIRVATVTPYAEFTVKREEYERLVKLRNTNWLTLGYLDLLGGKTGYIESSGHCLTVKIKGEQDQEIIIVVLGSQSNTDRFQDVKAIADFVFTNYSWENN